MSTTTADLSPYTETELQIWLEGEPDRLGFQSRFLYEKVPSSLNIGWARDRAEVLNEKQPHADSFPNARYFVVRQTTSFEEV